MKSQYSDVFFMLLFSFMSNRNSFEEYAVVINIMLLFFIKYKICYIFVPRVK